MNSTAKAIKAALASIPGASSGRRPFTYSKMGRDANAVFRRMGITTLEGKAVVIAQTMVESNYYRDTREIKARPGTDLHRNQQRYAPYYGAGFVQVTWKSGYAGFGAWAKREGLAKDANYFVNNPAKLGDKKWAWSTVEYYFVTNDLVGRANQGQNERVGMAIHAGDPYADRKGYPWSDWGRTRIAHTDKAYRAALQALKANNSSAPKPAGPVPSLTLRSGSRGERVRRLQQRLNRTFPAYSKLAVDGIFGKGTATVVREFQRRSGLEADGIVGRKTRAELKRHGITF